MRPLRVAAMRRLAMNPIAVAFVSVALASCGLFNQATQVTSPAAISPGMTTIIGGTNAPSIFGSVSTQPRFVLEVPKTITLEARAWSAGGSPLKVAVVATYGDETNEDVTPFATFVESGSSLGQDTKLLDISKLGDIRYRLAGSAAISATLVGLSTQSLSVAASHASPTNPDVSFTSSTGSTAYSKTGLLCRASGSTDPEGTTINYRFRWTGISGSPIRVVNNDGSVTETYIAANGDRGNAITCAAAAEDSAADPLTSHSIFGAQSFMVRDRPPSAPEVSIAVAIGTKFKVGGRIRCLATGSIDGDDDGVTYEIKWRNITGGSIIHEANGQETYTITESDIGKPIACDARATSDIQIAAESSPWASSDQTLQLADLPPVLTSVVFDHLIPDPSTLAPNTTVAYPGDVLVCTAIGYDPNGLTVRWGLTGDTVTRVSIFEITNDMRGTTITCVAKLVNSAGLSSSIVQKTFTVEDRPPNQPTVAIGTTSSNIVVGSNLACMGTTSDPDGDVPLIQNITWSGIAGQVNASASNMYTVTSADIGPISCSVTFCDIFPYKTLAACQVAKGVSYINANSCCAKTSTAGIASISLGNNNKPNTPVVSSFAVGLSSISGKGKVTGIWTNADGTTPPIPTADYLVAMYPTTTTWAPTDGGVYTTGQAINGGVIIGYAGAGVAGNTIGGAAGTLGSQFDIAYGRYKYALYARGTNTRYSSMATGEIMVGVTVTAVGPTPTLVRAERDSVYWDLVFDGASVINLTALNASSYIVPYGSPVGVTSGTPVVSVINPTTRRVTITGILGTGTLRFGVNANSASSLSGNALALSSFYVTPVSVEMHNVAPTDPAVTLTQQDGTLTCTATSSDANGDPFTYTYAWKRGGVTIAGQTASTYKISNDDESTSLACSVYAADAWLMSATVTSSSYAVNTFCSSFASLTGADAILGYPTLAYNSLTNPYLLCNPAQVTSIADGCGITTAGVTTTAHCAKSFKLRQDISMSGVTWTNKSIGSQDSDSLKYVPFSGILDGAGFALRGLTITRNAGISGYTAPCAAFMGRLTGTLKNISLDRLTVTSTIGDAAAILCESAVSAAANFSTVRTSAVVTSPTQASAIRTLRTVVNIGEKLDISGIYTATTPGTYSSSYAGILIDPAGYLVKSRTDKVTAFVTAVGTGSPGLPSGRDSIVIGSGFSQKNDQYADGSNTSFFGTWYPYGDLSIYTNPAVSESTRQLGVSRALFYNPYSGVPIAKYNQGAVYDSRWPGIASTTCITQAASGGTTYTNYPLRNVSANVFAGINHPVMHSIENSFGVSAGTGLYNCSGTSPYPIYPRTAFTDTEALPASLATAMTKQTYVDRGWDFASTWDFDDALPYLQTTTFPISYFNAIVDDSAGKTTNPVIKISLSFTKTATSKVDQVKIFARPSSSLPRTLGACALTSPADNWGTDKLVATYGVTGPGMVTQTNSVVGAGWNFPWDMWMCGYKNGSVVMDGVMVQSDLQPDLLRVLPVAGSLRLGFRAYLSSAVVNTYDELNIVEAPENASNSVVPTYCGASGSNKIVAALNVTTAAANTYINFTRSLNTPQTLNAGTVTSYMLCGKMNSTYVAANGWANQQTTQPTNMTPMFQYKNIQSLSAPVLSSVTTTPASPSSVTSTVVKGTMNMDGSVGLYSDAACSVSLATNVARATIEGAGVSVTLPANATTGIYYFTTATDGTQSVCNKIMDFIVNTVAPTITFGSPSVSQTRYGAVTVPITITGATTYNMITPTYFQMLRTGTANGIVGLSGSGSSYVATILGGTGFVVSKGSPQRSYIRYLDVQMASNADALAVFNNPSRVMLTKADLTGAGSTVVGLTPTSSPVVTPSVNDKILSFDLGTVGLLNSRNTGTADGYYTMSLDVDGNGIFETQYYFYRLFGDINGNGQVDANDQAMVLAQISLPYDATYDLNGDGAVNTSDFNYVKSKVGNVLSSGLTLSNSIAGDGTIAIRALANSALSNAGLGNAQGDSTTFLVDNTPPTITGSASFALSTATTLDTAVSDSGTGVNTADTLAVVWTQTSGTAGGINLSGWNLVAPSVSATVADTYGLLLTVKDRVGNTSTKAVSVVWNAMKASITIGPPSSIDTNGSSISWTVTYGNFVSVDTAATLLSKITLNPSSGITATKAVIQVSAGVYSVTLASPNGNGALGFTIPAGTAASSSGLTADAATSSTTLVDTLAPTYTLATSFISNSTTVATSITPTGVSDSGSGIATYAWSCKVPPANTVSCDSTINYQSGSQSLQTAIVKPTTDGSYSLYLLVTDNAGNTFQSSTPATLTLAATAPTVVITSGPSLTPSGSLLTQAKTGTSVTYGLTLTGCSSIQSDANLSGSTYSSLTAVGTATATRAIAISGSSGTATISSLGGNGTLALNILAAACTNVGGVPSAANGPSTSFKVDNTAPTVAITGVNSTLGAAITSPPASGTSSTDPNLTTGVTGSGIASYLWSATAVPSGGSINFGTSNASTTTVAPTAQGNYTLQLAVTDNVGNVGTSSVNFAYSTTAASVSIGSPTINSVAITAPVTGSPTIVFPVNYTVAPATSLTAANITVNGTGTAVKSVTGSGTSYLVSLAVTAGSSGTLGISVAPGLSQSGLGVLDTGAGPTALVTVDNSAPVLSAVGSTSLAATGPVTLTATASDSETSITYQWSNMSTGIGSITFGSSTANSTTISASAVGTYSVRLTVTNSAGLTSTVTYTVNWSPSIPIVSISKTSPSGSNVRGNTNIVYSVSFSPVTSSNLTTSNITLNNSTGSTASVSSVTPVGGNAYTVTLTTTTLLGNGTLGFSVNSGSASNYGASNTSTPSPTVLVDNTPPTVSAGVAVTAGSQVTLNGSASDAGSGLASTVWSMVSGPGTITWGAQTSPVTSVVASAGGSYVLRLTATDNSGNIATSDMTFTWNSTAPGISISNPSLTAVTTSNVTYDITYSGASTYSLVAGNISLTTTATAVVASKTVALLTAPNIYRVTLSGISGNGTVAISVASGTAANAGGVLAPAAGPGTSFKVDNSAPTGSIAAIPNLDGVVTRSATATASDPDLVASPQVLGVGNLTYTWSKVSGPGTVTFGSSSAATTTVDASSDGSYVIQCIVSDGLNNWVTMQQTMLVAKTRPTLTIGPPSRATTNTNVVDYLVTYSVASSITLTSGNVTLNKTGVANGTVSVIDTSPTGTNTTATGTRTVRVTPTAGDGTISLTIAAGTSTNLALLADNTGAGPSATFTVDRTPPIAPVVSALSDTTNLTPTISGTSEAGATITVFDGLTQLGTTTANGLGAWSYVPSSMTQALHSITAKATDAAGNQSVASASVSFYVDNTAPVGSMPSISAGATTSSSMTLMWTAATDNVSPVKLFYVVQYAASATATVASRTSSPSSLGTEGITQMVVSGLSPSTTYYFWLKVFDQSGNAYFSQTTSTLTATTAGNYLLAPSNFTATPNSFPGQIDLSWTAVAGATSYTLTSSTSLNGTYNSVYTGTSTMNSNGGLVAGNTYYYKLIANNAAGGSLTPATASAVPYATLSTPTALIATPGNSQVGLTWSASVGGNSGASLTYEVRRSSANTDPNASLSGWTSLSGSVSAATYTDATAVNGTTYYYSVRGIRTVSSSYASPVLGQAGPPSVPTNFTTASGYGANQLNWGSSTGMGSITYTIACMSAVANSCASGAAANTYVALALNQVDIMFIHVGVTEGVAYYYKVLATNSVGSSAYSAVQTVTAATAAAVVPAIATVTGSGPVTPGAHTLAWQTLSTTPTTYLSDQTLMGSYTGGMVVAMGDLDGDGKDEVMVASNTGGASTTVAVRRGSAITAENWYGFYPFGSTYTASVSLASCDVDNNGMDDIVVGRAGSGQVAVFYNQATMATWTFTIGQSTAATRVACADVNGDGYGDIVVGNSISGVIEIWSGKTKTNIFNYATGISNLFVAAGDWDGDGLADVFASPASGTSPRVYGFKSTGSALIGAGANTYYFSWQPYSSFNSTVAVGVVDGDDDGLMDVIGVTNAVNTAMAVRKSSNGDTLLSILAYSGWNGGIYAAGGHKSSFARSVMKPNILTVAGVNNSGTIYINTATPVVQGTGIGKNVIKLYVDGIFNSGAVKSTNAWSHTVSGALTAGAHTLAARAAYGNSFGPVSLDASVIVDLTAPPTPTLNFASKFFANSFVVTVGQGVSPVEPYFSGYRYNLTTDGTTPVKPVCAVPATGTLATGTSVTAASITIPAATTKISVVTCDLAGNTSATAATATYTYDNIAPLTPRITSPSPVNTWINAATTLTVAQNLTTDANFQDFRYTTTGINPTCASTVLASPFTYTVPGSGQTDFRVVACDKAGNVSATPLSYLFSYDGSAPAAPTLSVQSQGYTGTLNPIFTKSVTVDATFKEIRYNIGATPPATPTCSTGTVVASGGSVAVTGTTQSLSAISCDYAGNASSASTATYTLVALAFNSMSPDSPSNNITPIVTVTPNYAGTVTLYSNSICSTAISSANVVIADTAQEITTNSLSGLADGAVSIYSKFSGTSFTSCGLLTTYYKDTTAPGSFSITAPLASPAITAPPLVSWAASVGASSYDLKVATESGCASPWQTYIGLSVTNQTLTELPDSGTYYLCLVAWDLAGNSVAATNDNYSFIYSLPYAISTRTPFVVSTGSVITVSGTSFADTDVATIGGVSAVLTFASSTSATVTVPSGLSGGVQTLLMRNSGNTQSATAAVVVVASSTYPTIAQTPANVCLGTIYYDLTGIQQTGTKSCGSVTSNCTTNAQTGCVTTAAYTSADFTNMLAENINSGVTIAGVAGTNIASGTVTPTPTAWDIRAGVTAFGIVGKLKVNCRNAANLATFDIDAGQSVTSVTIGSPGVLNVTAHGLANGTAVRLNYTTAPAALYNTTIYYVVNSSTNSFQLSATSGGAGISVTTAGVGVTVHRWKASPAVVDIWDTIDDYYGLPASTGFPSTWSVANNYCGGVDTPETAADDDNVWKDVTTTNGTTASTCAATPANCTMKDKISGLSWSNSYRVSGSQSTLAWWSAVKYCNASAYNGQLAGSWRLPTQKELLNAYEHGITSAASANWMTLANMGGDFWSASHFNAGNADMVCLRNGNSGSVGTYVSYSVVCVR